MRARPLLLDVPLAVLVGLISLAAAKMHTVMSGGWTDRNWEQGKPWWEQADSGPPQFGPLNPLIFPSLLLIMVGVALRRIFPRAAFVITSVGVGGYLGFGGPFGPVIVAPALNLLAMARGLPLRHWGPWSALLVPMLWAEFVLTPYAGVFSPDFYRTMALGLTLMLLPVTFGTLRRIRRENERQLHEDELQRSAFEERLRIAREVHDVVGHSLSVINMQAGVALHVLQKRPEQAEPSLQAIRQTSKQALEELRSTLAVFRSTEGDLLRAPLPGLDRLDDLVANLRTAGHQARVITDGEPRTLPTAVDHAAYRIIQEALTNVSRHADGANAALRISYRPGVIELEISNDLDEAPHPKESSTKERGDFKEGNGILGMRERVRAVGGTLRAEPGPGGGFVVHAVLPTAPTKPTEKTASTEEGPE